MNVKRKWIYKMVIFTLLAAAVIFMIRNPPAKEAKIINIGVLTIGDSRYEKLFGLKNGLKELGYHQNDLHFIIKNSKADPLKLKKQIAELLEIRPDLIVTLGGIETIELKKAMDISRIKIPVVFAGIASPQEIGIIQSEKTPGGQFTGINNFHASISGKRLETLYNLIPSIKRVHILYDDETEISRLGLNNTLDAAEKLSLTVKVWNAADKTMLKQLEKNLTKNDALFILPSFRIESMTDTLVKMANRHHLPTMGIYEYEVKKGFLASYGTSLSDQGFQAARYVSLILKGNSPREMPVEMPDNIRFLINKQEQNLLGIPLNQDLLKIAEFRGADRRGLEKDGIHH